MTLPIMSMGVPFLTAETTPMGTAMSTLTNMAKPASCRLAGMALPMRSIALWPWNLMEGPKSSRSALPTKRKYCSHEGLVEAPEGRDAPEVFLRRVGGREHVEGAAGDADEREDDDAHAYEREHRLEEPDDDVALHAGYVSASPPFPSARGPWRGRRPCSAPQA